MGGSIFLKGGKLMSNLSKEKKKDFQRLLKAAAEAGESIKGLKPNYVDRPRGVKRPLNRGRGCRK